jgi:outer membrane protein TolC
MGRPITSSLNVDTGITISTMNYTQLYSDVWTFNTALLQLKSNQKITQLQLDEDTGKIRFPKLLLTGSYRSNNSNFNSSSANPNHFQGNISLTYNLFNGGKDIRDTQNTYRARSALLLKKNEFYSLLEKEFYSLKSTHLHLLKKLSISNANYQVSYARFEQLNKRDAIGTASALEFREAQLSLKKAELLLLETRINTKLSELALRQLAGQLI